MARSLQDMIDDNDAAIARIETGAQAYTIRGRESRMAELRTLYAERERLEQKSADAGNGGSMTSVGKIMSAR